MDARLQAIEEALQRVTQILATVGLSNPERPLQNQNNNTSRNQEDGTVRIDIHEFDGKSDDPEVYIEWEACLDKYFEYKETSSERQYKLAKIKLTKLVAVWLESIQKQRRRDDRASISTWEKLKKHLRKKYVPSNYKEQLYVQWNTLSQGNKSVSEFIQEWERLSVLCEVHETEDMRVGKFLTGLKEDIRKK